MRVRAKTVTKTVSKTLPPVEPFEFSVPNEAKPASLPPQEAVVGITLPEEEQERAEVFRQVEEAVADEGLQAFRELPLDENLLEECIGAEQKSVAISEQEEERTQEAGLVILGTPPIISFMHSGEATVEQEDESPVVAPVFAVESSPTEPAEAPVEAESEVRSEASPMPEAAPEPSARTAIPCPGRPYMVRRGDSFQLIARRFDVSVRALMDANPELQPGRLVVGDVLCVPMPESPAPVPAHLPEPPTGESMHRVGEGESIADILLAGNVSLSAFQALNPGLRLGQQRVGDVVRMPQHGTRGRCEEGLSQQVAEGEDITALAMRHGVTVGMLLRANPHLLPTDFRSGQVVCVPKQG